jgi:hypothetical protein
MPANDSSIEFNEFSFNEAPFNAWSYPVAPKNIASIIRSTIKYPFRKVEIKRRQSSDAQYESSWLDITDYVERYGSIQTAIDSTRINQFLHSGVNLTVRNDYGQFNPEWDGQSLFFGYLTRVRTQVRISAGYTDGSGNQFPDDPVQGIFVLTGEINIASSNNQVNLNCKSLASIFQEVRADELDGITSSITSSRIVELIRDATDGSGNLLFRTFITSTSWDIQTTTAIINNLGTTTSLEQYSVWELMVKLAEVERFVVHISNNGGLVFGNRQPNTVEPTFHLYGAGYRDPNIIKITNYKEAVDKLYTHTIFKFLEDDTDSSYISAGTATTIDPTSNEWKYGRRTYEFENNLFTDTGTAQLVATSFVNEFSNLKSELSVDCEFLPHIELLDNISVSYTEKPQDLNNAWDVKDWAADTTTADGANFLSWSSETSAAIQFNQKNFKVISKQTNLDTFITSLIMRETEG